MFGKKKKGNLIGLDIGSRAIKLAEIDENKKGQFLKKFGIYEIPPGLIEEGTVKSPDEVADAIKKLVKMHKVREPNVAISVGGYSIIVKTITVQKMEQAQLQETISFEAEQYIPFDISDVNLDFQMLGENPGNPSQMDVLLVAGKKDIVKEYAGIVQLAGLNPLVVDVDAFALQNIFEVIHEEEEEGENIALIDIGTSKTTLNILKNKVTVLIRDVSMGCGQINQKVMELVGCSIEEAEEIYNSRQKDKMSSKDIVDAVSDIVGDWCAEIRRALDFFYSTYPSDHIKKIVLSGGGANIKKFRQQLASETSSLVEIINPFEKFSLDSSLDPDFLEQVAPQADICMGLALRRIGDK